jgi:hypothetical protein
MEWTSIEEVKEYKSPMVESVGWLIEETKDNIKICLHNCNSEDGISTVSVIPKGMIREIKTIWTKKGSVKDGQGQNRKNGKGRQD